jgi:hypothetical protein
MKMETDIPAMWSPMSVVSFVGILYLLLCVLMVIFMKFKGWCDLWMFLFLGVCWIGLNMVDIYSCDAQKTGYQPMVRMAGEWRYVQLLLLEDIDPPDDQNEWKYAMHVPDSEFYYLPHYIWHPACLFYCPFFTLLLSFVLWFFT